MSLRYFSKLSQRGLFEKREGESLIKLKQCENKTRNKTILETVDSISWRIDLAIYGLFV